MTAKGIVRAMLISDGKIDEGVARAVDEFITTNASATSTASSTRRLASSIAARLPVYGIDAESAEHALTQHFLSRKLLSEVSPSKKTGGKRKQALDEPEESLPASRPRLGAAKDPVPPSPALGAASVKSYPELLLTSKELEAATKAPKGGSPLLELTRRQESAAFSLAVGGLITSGEGFKVYRVRASCPNESEPSSGKLADRLSRGFWAFVKAINDTVLGNVEQYGLDSVLYIAVSDDQIPSTSKKSKAVGHAVIGCCVARELDNAVRVHLEDAAEIGTTPDPSGPSPATLQRWASDVSELGDIRGSGCIAGVQLVWAHPQWHRRGVATELVDSMRKSLVYGVSVQRQQVAFSQPTRDGKAFAIRYTGRRDFLVFV